MVHLLGVQDVEAVSGARSSNVTIRQRGLSCGADPEDLGGGSKYSRMNHVPSSVPYRLL